jgi:hypothetical protein
MYGFTGRRGDIADHVQTKKLEDALLPTSSSTKVSSLLKEISVGENELKWRAKKECSHIATLNTASTSAQEKAHRNCFFVCFIENYLLSGGKNEATAADVLDGFLMTSCQGLVLSYFFTASAGAFNRKSVKLVQILIQFFRTMECIKNKLLEVHPAKS